MLVKRIPETDPGTRLKPSLPSFGTDRATLRYPGLFSHWSSTAVASRVVARPQAMKTTLTQDAKDTFEMSFLRFTALLPLFQQSANVVSNNKLVF
jgi:hypothetical protein